MKWLGATVTYSGGASYRIGGYVFLPNRPKPVSSKKVVDAIRGNRDFTILDRFEEAVEPDPQPEKTTPTMAPQPEKKPETAVPKPPRKKTVKRGWKK